MCREIRSGPSRRYREWGVGGGWGDGDWEKKAWIELFLDWSPADVPVWPFVLAFECILSPKKVVSFFLFLSLILFS